MNKPIPQTPMVFELINGALTCNLDTLPDKMRKAGFLGRDNALWFTIAFVMALGPDKELINLTDSEMAVLNTQRKDIYEWFDGAILTVKIMMGYDPNLRVVAITNDGVDRCGFRLGPVITSRLSEFGNRVESGYIFTYDLKGEQHERP